MVYLGRFVWEKDMTKTEIIVSLVVAVLSSAVLNGIITHLLYKNKLKKEREIGHEKMIGDKIYESLTQARELELMCKVQEIYDPEKAFSEEEFSAWNDQTIYLGITKDQESFSKFVDRISELRTEYDQYMSYKESAYLKYIENYCLDFFHFAGVYNVSIKEAGAVFIYDFQRWQQRFERILIKRMNNPKYKLYDKSRIGWRVAQHMVKRELKDKSLLYKVKNNDGSFEAKAIRAGLIEKNEEKANKLIDEWGKYEKKHFIRAFIRRTRNKL